MEQLPDAWRSVEADPAESQASPAPGANRIRLVAAGMLALALVLAAAAMLVAAPGSGTEGVAVARGSAGTVWLPSPGAAAARSGQWMIDVAGAVARPGLYALPPGSRVADAIRAAGGYGPRVDASAAAAMLNLAEILHDGAKVVVPARGSSPTGAGGTSSGAAAAGGGGIGAGSAAGTLVDLNRATASQLDTLPGVGPVTAARIIAAREERRFESVDDLLTRKVVSTSVMAKIRSLVTVGGG